MGRPPAFQLYVKDWLTSKKRAAMSLDQQAAYMNLLCHCWDTDDCSLPDDPALLAALSELREAWNTCSTLVRQAFEQHPNKPGFITNMRLYAEHYKYVQIQKERRMAGRKSGASRRNHKKRAAEQVFDTCSTLVEQMPNSSSSSSSSSSKKEYMRGALLNGHRASFDRFWTVYPRKRSKGQAEQAWAKLKPDDALLGTMLTAIEQAKRTPEWIKDRGKFIPYPSTWLKAKGWEDEHFLPANHERIPL